MSRDEALAALAETTNPGNATSRLPSGLALARGTQSAWPLFSEARPEVLAKQLRGIAADAIEHGVREVPSYSGRIARLR